MYFHNQLKPSPKYHGTQIPILILLKKKKLCFEKEQIKELVPNYTADKLVEIGLVNLDASAFKFMFLPYTML